MKSMLYILLIVFPILLQADIDLQPLFSLTRENPVLGKKDDIRILGPFFEFYKGSKDSTLLSVRPVVSLEKENGRSALDILWPLGGMRERGAGTDFWTFCYYHYTSKDSLSSVNHVFPLVYTARNRENSDSWFVFPFCGDVKRYLNLGETFFIMWPLYVRTKQGSMNNHYIIWPFFGWGSGEKGNHIRIFPLYLSREIHEQRVTSSYLWPLLTVSKSLNPKNPGYAVFSFPLGGHSEWGGMKHSAVLWPFFTWKNNADGSFIRHLPWPLFQYGKGVRGESFTNVWPFFGLSSSQESRHAYFLWPLGTYQKAESERRLNTWLCFFPFYWDFRKQQLKNSVIEYRRRHIWPLISVFDEGKTQVIRGLDLIPAKRVGGWERNLLPWITLFEYRKNECGESWEILWNMFGGTYTKKSSRFHIGPFYSQESSEADNFFEMKTLFGLYQFRSSAEESRSRFFYFLDISVKK